MAIGRTLLERYSGRTTQHDGFIRPIRGKKLTYAKVHTCDFGVEKYLTPGEDFYVCSLNTACGDVRVGAMICYGRSSRKAQGFSCSGGLS